MAPDLKDLSLHVGQGAGGGLGLLRDGRLARQSGVELGDAGGVGDTSLSFAVLALELSARLDRTGYVRVHGRRV